MRSPTRKTMIMRKDANRELLVDKLSERWVAERAAVTLYPLAAARLAGAQELAAQLSRFGAQEELHAQMLEQLLAELGHDPHGEPTSPSVNLVTAEMETMLELTRDPRLENRHVLEVLLSAEVLDVAGWELLVELGREADLEEDWLRAFRTASREEREHEHVFRAQLLAYERGALLGSKSV